MPKWNSILSHVDCVLRYARPLMTCLAERGISVSIQSATNPNIPVALTIRRHRIGSIVLLDGLNLTSSDNVLHVVNISYLEIAIGFISFAYITNFLSIIRLRRNYCSTIMCLGLWSRLETRIPPSMPFWRISILVLTAMWWLQPLQIHRTLCGNWRWNIGTG